MFDSQRRNTSSDTSPLLASELVEVAVAAPDSAPDSLFDAMSREICDTRSLNPRQVIEMICDEGYSHVVQADSLAYEKELAAADRMIAHPDEFFSNPLKTVFGAPAENTVAFHLTLDAAERKHRLLNELSGLLANLKGAKRVLVQAMAMADELYTNASKNGWDYGDQFYVDPVRRAGTIDFYAAADGERLLLCCRDTFGTLSLPRLLARLRLCSENGIANSISTTTAGAGIGAYLTFDSSLSYYVGSRPGECTVVAAALPLGLSTAVYSELPKNIHIVG